MTAYAVAVVVLLTYLVAGSALADASRRLTGRGPAAGPVNHVGATLNEIMAAQSTAIVKGDRDGYLRYVDHASAGSVDAFAEMYDNLRAMHTTMWRALSFSGDAAVAARQTYTVNVAYCFVVARCRTPLTVILHMEAAVVGDQVLLERLVPPQPDASGHDPRPWQVSRLTAAVGDRVVVAASPQYADRVAEVLKIAQSAIKEDDGFAHWGKPDVYVLYLAGTSDAVEWFNTKIENAAGYATSLSPTDIEAVAIMPYVGDVGEGGLETIIRHEFAHVATLQNVTSDRTDSFVEGIAEYAAYRDNPSWGTWRYSEVKKYARGKWKGDVLLTDEIGDDPAISSAAYGIGYLALKRIVEKYGMDKMLDFWGAIEQDDKSADDASRSALGVDWDTVNADCAAYVRQTVGA